MTSEPSDPSPSPFEIALESPQPWERILRVTVPREHFDREYTKRLTHAVRSFERPGFRRGKAPRRLVERELGDRLRAETFEAIVPRVFQTAVIEHELAPITDPELRNLHFEEGEPITFDLHLEVRPRVTAADYENLPIKRREVVVENRAVDEVLARLRESRAIWEPVERKAERGDRIIMDITALDDTGSAAAAVAPADAEDPADAPARVVQDQRMILGETQNLPDFDAGLTGVVAGDEREITTTYPDDHPRDDFRGRKLRFRCAVKEVQRKVLPEVDDAFAARVAEGKTLLELRGEIRSHLERDAEAAVSREMDEQIVDRLVERHEVAVPPSLIEQYLASSVEELHARNTQLGSASSPEEDREFRELTRSVAERVLRGMFVMEAVRRQEKIAVSEEEIETRIVEIAHENGFDVDKYREYVIHGDERSKIRHGLEERKTLDFLRSRAEIETVPHDAEIPVGPQLADSGERAARPSDAVPPAGAAGADDMPSGAAEDRAAE